LAEGLLAEFSDTSSRRKKSQKLQRKSSIESRCRTRRSRKSRRKWWVSSLPKLFLKCLLPLRHWPGLWRREEILLAIQQLTIQGEIMQTLVPWKWAIKTKDWHFILILEKKPKPPEEVEIFRKKWTTLLHFLLANSFMQDKWGISQFKEGKLIKCLANLSTITCVRVKTFRTQPLSISRN
jgi:hypothetical protein